MEWSAPGAGRIRAVLLELAATLAAALAAGCSAPPREAPRRMLEPTDACAMRLHDICGHFLLYHATRGKLPDGLEDLKENDGGGPLPPFECPLSKRPYAYEPKGFPAPGQRGRVVLRDAAPVHAGLRWGVLVEEPAPGSALVTRVIALVEEESQEKAQENGQEKS